MAAPPKALFYVAPLSIRTHRLRDDLIEGERDRFTETISSSDWRIHPNEGVLLWLRPLGDGDPEDIPDTLWLGLIERGGAVASYTIRVKFSNLILLSDLSVTDLMSGLSAETKDEVVGLRGTGGPLLRESWLTIAEHAKTLRPQLAAAISQLQSRVGILVPRSLPVSGDPEMERDAIAVSLQITGIDRAMVLDWTAPAAPAPFMHGLRSVRVNEDQIIQHDADVFGDWARGQRVQTGYVEFESRQHRLTVMNVNRTGVEKTLGVDLVYYHHTYGGYVLVRACLEDRRISVAVQDLRRF